MLVVAEDHGKFEDLQQEIVKCGGLERIELLRSHAGEEVEKKAIYIYDFYLRLFYLFFYAKNEFGFN